MKTDHLKVCKQFHQVSRKPKIFITYDDYDNTTLELDIEPVSKIEAIKYSSSYNTKLVFVIYEIMYLNLIFI